MKTYTYIEEYLEVMNGDRDPVTGKLYGLFNTTPPIVSLARYDVNILSSMSSATQEGKPLTDRQAELAVKLVLKYRKQLEKLEIGVGPVEQPKFKLGIRQIDRRKILTVDGDSCVLKFPYETQLINNLRELAKESQGSWQFNNENKAWHIAITELNVFAVNGFANNHGFEIDAEFKKLYQLVVDCEAVPYEIKLIQNNNKLEILNGPKSLLMAINNYCELDASNLDLLVDNSSVYGYSVDTVLADDLCNKYSPRIYNLMTTAESKFSPSSDESVYKDVVEYAKIVGRYPIYVYEPDLSSRLLDSFVKKYFTDDDVYQTRLLDEKQSTIHKKVIYFSKYNPNWEQPIPLLISGQGMMHGAERSLLLQQAKKVVYFATEVYNARQMKSKN
jgi:hypothetical protein